MDGAEEFVCNCEHCAREVVVSEFDGITDAELSGVFGEDLVVPIVF